MTLAADRHQKPTLADPTLTDPAVLTEVETLVRQWLDASASAHVEPAAKQLAAVLRDESGLDFTVGFVDRVIRPEDVDVAARNLRELATQVPAFLPWYLRTAVRTGAAMSTVAPRPVVAAARKALRHMVDHLIVDATDDKLGASIARIRKSGVRLNVNLLGEAVLGENEASRRMAGTIALLERPDVDYVSIKVSATVAPHSPWAFDQAVEHITESLVPLFRVAAQNDSTTNDSTTNGVSTTSGTATKFINLDMEEYRDLDLTIAVFTRLLDRAEFAHLEAGIVLQAYLPDALSAMMRLQEWAAARRASGGAGIKVRLVKGANLPMEQVEASLHDWPVATWGTKCETDTNYKLVLDYALTPERVANVRVGVAGHNLFDIAYAWTLAGRRDARDGIEFEMLLGMAEGQAKAVARTVGGLLLYTPVVHPQEFDVAIAYLVRRLEEGASQDNFMSAVFDLHDHPELFDRERERFLASLDGLRARLGSDHPIPVPNRVADRRTDDPESVRCRPGHFANTPDTDLSVDGNRLWGNEITARVAGSVLGEELVARHTVDSPDQVDRLIEETTAAGAPWREMSGARRALVLRSAAVELERRRGDLLEVMAAECGKTLDQADPEVSEAIDFVNYYALLAEGLDVVDGAIAEPVRLTVVTPPWNFPVAIPTGSTVAALAAGSPVIIKPAPQARRCGSVMVQALWDAGVPREVLRLVHTDEGAAGARLVSHPGVDRLILTGAFATAETFRSMRPDLPLLAETSGKNAIVVTPHADLDLAVKDLVASAFGHAGQKCSAASLGILVGSVANSRRFRDQLVDAVSSLTVGYPDDPTAQMGPVIEPASGKLLSALTTLEPGEQWLVEPRRLDDSGRLWSPGVKTGVARGSQFHLTEYFGPVLGLMAASDLDEAIAMQNDVDYGLTAGVHSLDRDELSTWVNRVEAGNLYINRGITGAVVRRQPFGGWKRSAVGAGTKAGGPNYLVGLTNWRRIPAAESLQPHPVIATLPDIAVAAGVPGDDVAALLRSLRSDAKAWDTEYSTVRDVSGLVAERNWLRYLPVPVWVRAESDARLWEVLRVVGAGLVAGAELRVSSVREVPDDIVAAFADLGVTVVVEDGDAWRASLAALASGRVRLIGGDTAQFAADSGGRPEIALYGGPVVEAGRVEMLTFLREQSISATAHRFGSPSRLVDGLVNPMA
ncbi:bifunctional proline dehydrogenase/L-glutamate gamma-semialdehyde dehydrogenase [Gordonia jinhuaensis]|uniref:L-glutamate gamma-semialdehyde dehydrogenase n=1 Tax=Gordonia jinhuaensis TaxID=1517702 RepID=A0A916WUU9_9ACTN|nr:bifunctional proline dehydrogenase/L-glutamate gamma-semialdehyde dehydrogenase [Gordonia jinhuaensis]GGB31884.1 1-pyrroline-5-carboxylate dehydrogenase [Gordonia jinhuaensis]